MIEVIQERENLYTIKLGNPELCWIEQAAKGMGMDRCTVLASSFSKGMEYYFDMIREIEAHNNKQH